MGKNFAEKDSFALQGEEFVGRDSCAFGGGGKKKFDSFP